MGADTKDWAKIASAEHLDPIETSMRKNIDLANEVLSGMRYMKRREATHRDTNGTLSFCGPRTYTHTHAAAVC